MNNFKTKNAEQGKMIKRSDIIETDFNRLAELDNVFPIDLIEAFLSRRKHH
jgi:hypothetical protein